MQGNGGADLLTMLSNLGGTFRGGQVVVFSFMGAFGLYIGLVAGFQTYLHATGENRAGMMSREMIPWAYVLAGALAVPPIIMWKSANTFVLGGQKTYDAFAYLQGTPSASYCDNAVNTLTLFFMLFGLISIAAAGADYWGHVKGSPRSHSSTRGWVFFIGGILLFFINDTAAIASATVKIPIGLPQVCAALGAG